MPGSQPFGLDRIGQISVTAHDMDRAVTFYRDRLGMRFLFQVPSMAFFQCGDVSIMLGTPEAPEFDHPASILYYLVDDISAAHRTLVERGVTFIRDPALTHRAPDHELWIGFFKDSEGNTVAIMARKPLADSR
jgi:predicted enzyme related to lactoylglutathione lyase